MIYIDPPYNTGKDFVYKDNYRDNLKNYRENYGQKDAEGNAVGSQSERNSEADGKYHSNWLNMMYPRLQVARNLLREDGIIFISIDDHELENLRMTCHQIFGEENFIANIIWEKVHTRKNSAKTFSVSHDHILAFAKVKDKWDRHLLPRENTDAYKNPDADPKGPWKPDPITAHNEYSAEYTITKPNGVVLHRPIDRYWAYSHESWKEKVENNEVIWGEGNSYPMIKRYLAEVQDGLVPTTLFKRTFAGDSSKAKKEIDSLTNEPNIFDYPKPTLLIQRLAQISLRHDEIVLDFFAGSATTGHAIFKDNIERGLNNRFILVQLPESTDSSASGYNYLTQVSRARLSAAASVLSDNVQSRIDLGFRVFKLDSSNVRAWDPNPGNLGDNLFADNIKEDRSELDLVFEILLKYGLDLSLPIKERAGEGHTFYAIGAGALILCLGKQITRRAAETILAWAGELGAVNPKVVFRDTGFTSSVEKTNAYELLRSGEIEDVKSV